ncbi:MAG: GNAT family N-acetyltransferase [Bacteroidales bacterium]|nr:GNAT family N-acetyltransferase [Bacteroidales bacterium]
MRGENINLRALEPSDINLLYQWENDMSLWKLSNTLTPFSRFTLEQYVLNAQQDIFAIKQLRLMIDLNDTIDDDKSIGCIDLFDYEPLHRRAGIGLMIIKNYRQRGYGFEAIQLISDYSKVVLNLHQLFCNITADNQISFNVFQKAGFQVIGLKKQWLFINNEWKDEYLLQKILQ